jgi:hypothetical protein
MDLLRGAAIIVVLCNFSAARGSEWHKMCFLFFFTCFFLSNTSLGLTTNPSRQMTHQLIMREHVVSVERSRFSLYNSCLCCTCTIELLLHTAQLQTPTPACWTLDSVQCPHYCPKIVLFDFRGECRSGDPNKSTLPIIFQPCASSIFFRAHISRGKGTLRTTE